MQNHLPYAGGHSGAYRMPRGRGLAPEGARATEKTGDAVACVYILLSGSLLPYLVKFIF